MAYGPNGDSRAKGRRLRDVSPPPGVDRGTTEWLLAVAMVCGAAFFVWAVAMAPLHMARAAQSAEPLGRSEPPCGAVRFTAERWYDADTAKGVTFHFALGVSIRDDDGLRIDNADAWEIGGRRGQAITDAERERGRRAVLHLRDTFDESEGFIELSKAGRDKYGRPLGRVWLKRERDGRWVDVGEWIRANGHDRSGT